MAESMRFFPDETPMPGDHLVVVFGGNPHTLKWTNVSSDPRLQVLIPWLDPKEDPDMGMDAAEDMAKIAKDLGVGMGIGFPSSKSEPMTRHAWETAVEADDNDGLTMFSRARKIEDIPEELRFYAVAYNPVTSPDEAWYLYPDKLESVEAIREAYSQGEKIALFDDVYSSGGTIWAGREIINKVLGLNATKEELALEFPGIVAMWETADARNNPPPPDGLYPVIIAPVIVVPVDSR